MYIILFGLINEYKQARIFIVWQTLSKTQNHPINKDWMVLGFAETFYQLITFLQTYIGRPL